jgi:hypothetical protein
MNLQGLNFGIVGCFFLSFSLASKPPIFHLAKTDKMKVAIDVNDKNTPRVGHPVNGSKSSGQRPSRSDVISALKADETCIPRLVR